MGSNAMSHAHHFLESITNFVLPEFFLQKNRKGCAVVVERKHKPKEELLVANSIPICIGRWEESWILEVDFKGKILPVPVNREQFESIDVNDEVPVRYKRGRHSENILITDILM